MNAVPVVLPDLGTPDVWVSVWFVELGEPVDAGDRLVEVLIDGATFDVASPTAGRLLERLAQPGERVRAGQALGRVSDDFG